MSMGVKVGIKSWSSQVSVLLFSFILAACGGKDDDKQGNTSAPPSEPPVSAPIAVTTPILAADNTNLLPDFGEPTGSAVLAAGVKVLSPAENQNVAIEGEESITFNTLPQLRVGEVFLTEKGAYKVADIGRPDANGKALVTVSQPTMEELFTSLKISGTTHVSGWEIIKDASDQSSLKSGSNITPSNTTSTKTFSTKALAPGLISSFQLTDLIRQLGFAGGELSLKWKSSSMAVDYEYDASKGGVQKAYIAASPELEAQIKTQFQAGIPLFSPDVEVFKISRPVPITVASIFLDRLGIRIARWQFALNLGFNGQADFGLTTAAQTKISAVGGLDYKIDQPFKVVRAGSITGDVTNTTPEILPSSPTGATVSVSGDFYFKVVPSIVVLGTVAVGGVDIKFSNIGSYQADIQRSVDPGYCLSYSNSGKIAAEGFFKSVGISQLKSPSFEIFNQPLIPPRKEGFCSTLSVTVSPKDPMLKIGDMTTLVAQLVDVEGKELPSTAGFKWTSSNPAVASVNASSGVVSGLKDGVASITATDNRTLLKAATNVTVISNQPVVARNFNFCRYNQMHVPGWVGIAPFAPDGLPVNQNEINQTLYCFTDANLIHMTYSESIQGSGPNARFISFEQITYDPNIPQSGRDNIITAATNSYDNNVLVAIFRENRTRDSFIQGIWNSDPTISNFYIVRNGSIIDSTECGPRGGLRTITDHSKPFGTGIQRIPVSGCRSFAEIESINPFKPNSMVFYSRSIHIQRAPTAPP